MNNKDYGFARAACEAIGAPDVVPRLVRSVQDRERGRILQILLDLYHEETKYGKKPLSAGLMAAINAIERLDLEDKPSSAKDGSKKTRIAQGAVAVVVVTSLGEGCTTEVDLHPVCRTCDHFDPSKVTSAPTPGLCNRPGRHSPGPQYQWPNDYCNYQSSLTP